ncbi:MAG: hypothetical protein JO110_04415 [Acetobacteraceae bacterium]|nr:hypothetical protein [Acetobacteraceae bacterium]
MVGIVLTPEQVRSAPAEVREWIKAQIEAEFAGGLPLGSERGEAHRVSALSACRPDEALAVLDRIHRHYMACQVFFELGRDSPGIPRPPELHRTTVGDIIGHARLDSVDHLGACLATIQNAFREVRQDPGAALFAFDERGGC